MNVNSFISHAQSSQSHIIKNSQIQSLLILFQNDQSGIKIAYYIRKNCFLKWEARTSLKFLMRLFLTNLIKNQKGSTPLQNFLIMKRMIQGMYQLITLISKSLSIKMYNFLNVTCNYCDPLSPREITTILNLMNHCLYLFNHFYHLCLNAKQRFYFFTYYINEIIYLLQLIFFLTSSV